MISCEMDTDREDGWDMETQFLSPHRRHQSVHRKRKCIQWFVGGGGLIYKNREHTQGRQIYREKEGLRGPPWRDDRIGRDLEHSVKRKHLEKGGYKEKGRRRRPLRGIAAESGLGGKGESRFSSTKRTGDKR